MVLREKVLQQYKRIIQLSGDLKQNQVKCWITKEVKTFSHVSD
jgi:hypothetical protein